MSFRGGLYFSLYQPSGCLSPSRRTPPTIFQAHNFTLTSLPSIFISIVSSFGLERQVRGYYTSTSRLSYTLTHTHYIIHYQNTSLPPFRSASPVVDALPVLFKILHQALVSAKKGTFIRIIIYNLPSAFYFVINMVMRSPTVLLTLIG